MTACHNPTILNGLRSVQVIHVFELSPNNRPPICSCGAVASPRQLPRLTVEHMLQVDWQSPGFVGCLQADKSKVLSLGNSQEACHADAIPCFAGRVDSRLSGPRADNLDGQASTARANAFWLAVAKGDTDAMQAFYAPKVLLKAGSELLKPQWELAEDVDRSKDLLVDRDRLLRGYSAMIDKIGKDAWTRVFGRIPKESVRVATADRDDHPLAGVQRGDTILKIATGTGDDVLLFVFRKDSGGNLYVHLEATDY